MKHRSIRYNKTRYLHLSELGSKFSMSFSSHEVLGDKIMGLDGINKKLLVLEQTGGQSRSYIIDLDETKAISVKKIYSSIKAGELKKRRIEAFLKTIQLQFEFGNGKEDIVLPFYESKIDSVYDLPGLERKIKNWQMILSKMIGIKNINPNREKRESQMAD
ncbi:MAG: hypothetical protein ABI675_25795 [Chitinophagaceae bacterium]